MLQMRRSASLEKYLDCKLREFFVFYLNGSGFCEHGYFAAGDTI